ncbi:SgcJ/EcaC family oxidoreductase [Azospirillum sp. SYSU D00513]|uniref:YybH family protein n=1 Tax=Azospirillum sp. SYSU D00513 TaxID=2812561 RepID=UPI001A97B8A0|nr:SgcJ/EcaC family oxidoreductase [Azospirillum sp. SYSU D00513]
MTSDALSSLTRAWENAFNAKDAAGLAALYTPQARLLTPTRVIATGAEEIRGYLATLLDHGIAGHRFEPVEGAEEGATAWQVGRWQAQSPGGGEHGERREGNYSLILRREGADWRIHAHIWN